MGFPALCHRITGSPYVSAVLKIAPRAVLLFLHWCPRTMKTLALLLAALVLSAVAFPDGGNEHHFRVPPASSLAIPAKPDRALVWGDVNILHTTDVHGWLLGHQKLSPPEPNYRCVLSGDSCSSLRLYLTQRNPRRLCIVCKADEYDRRGKLYERNHQMRCADTFPSLIGP